MENQKVWAPDLIEGYVLGTIVDIGSEMVTVECLKDRKVCFYFFPFLDILIDLLFLLPLSSTLSSSLSSSTSFVILSDNQSGL
jgi:PREDICTED: myosin VIb-like